MKYLLLNLFLLIGSICTAQENEITYDTIIYSEDSHYVFLEPQYKLGEKYSYLVKDSSLRIQNGDTISNRLNISKFEIIVEGIDQEGIDFELLLEEEYWKKMVLYDTLYSSWNMASIPKCRLKYLFKENNFSLKDHQNIGKYLHKYNLEAKTYLEDKNLSDNWDLKIAIAQESKSRDSTVIRNWLTFSSGVYTLFTYYSSLYPKSSELKFELNQKSGEFDMSTYFIIKKEKIDQDDVKYIIEEDLSRAANSSKRMFEMMKETFSELDTSKSYNNYKSETRDKTFLIVNKSGIIKEISSISSDMAILESGVSNSKQCFSN